MLKNFDINKYKCDIPIVIWGTGLIGAILGNGLSKRNIPVKAYVDSFRKGLFLGRKIITPEELSDWYYKEKIIILIGVTRKRQEIINILKKLNIEDYYDAWDLMEVVVQENRLLQKASFCEWEIRESYLKYKWEVHEPQKLWIRSVDLEITEKCSMKCRDCSNLMQYYKQPVNVNFEILRDSFNKFLKEVDMIWELRIIGGEPFMNPDIYKIIEMYKCCDKIRKIGVWTNATIFPDVEKRQLIRDAGVRMRFSDYDVLSHHLKDWIEYCEKEDIYYEVNKMEKWHDLGKLSKRNYSEEELKQVYQSCECRSLPTFLHGKLYNCPYSANADCLHAMKKNDAEKDSLNFAKSEYTKDTIKEFLNNRQYLMACDYCSGRNFAAGEVEAHIQTKKELQYKQYIEDI